MPPHPATDAAARKKGTLVKKALGALFGLIALIIVGTIGVFALADTGSGPVSDAASDVKAAATNVILDNSGVKEQAKEALSRHSDAIAAATGLTTGEVSGLITNLNIDDWKAAALPSDATVAATVDASTLGIDGTVTLYDDPGYVTLNAYGQNVTFEVPESAQDYLPSLASAS